MASHPQSEIFATLVQFFREDGWTASQVEGELTLSLAFQGDNGQWLCYAIAREAERQVAFYSVSPVEVPEAKRLAVAEFLTRANYGLIIGNFELDWADGEVRFKVSSDLESKPSLDLIRRVVYTNVLVMDQYLPGIMNVVYTDASPEQAIDEVER